jgi:hypothetical protein
MTKSYVLPGSQDQEENRLIFVVAVGPIVRVGSQKNSAAATASLVRAALREPLPDDGMDSGTEGVKV